MEDIKAGFELVRDGIETADRALELYNKVLDKVVPWGTLEETIRNLTQFETDYSKETAKLIGEIKQLLLNAQNYYHESTQTMYEWCGITVNLLPVYISFLKKGGKNDAEVKAQKQLILKILDDGIVRMTAAQKKLADSSMTFNKASGQLVELNERLKGEFDSNSSYYKAQVEKIRKEAYAGAAAGVAGGPFGLVISYSIAAGVVEGKLIPALNEKLKHVKGVFERLSELVKKSTADISETKNKLGEEIKAIGEIKISAETTKVFAGFDETMIAELEKAANRLIKQCSEYMKRHSSGMIDT